MIIWSWNIKKIINLLNNTPNQLYKFRTKNWIVISDLLKEVYITNCQSKFKFAMLKSSVCDYSDAYILSKGRITVIAKNNSYAAARQADERNKGEIFQNCGPFINCNSEINNTEIDNAKDVDIVMPMYNLIKYSHNIWKVMAILQRWVKW